jgi:hypothetical protein
MRSFYVASSWSRLTGERGGGGGALPHGTWPHPRPVDPSGMSRIGSSEVCDTPSVTVVATKPEQ